MRIQSPINNENLTTILKRLNHSKSYALIAALSLTIFSHMHMPRTSAASGTQASKRFELVASGVDRDARGRVSLSHQQPRRGRETQELTVSLHNLTPKAEYQLTADSIKLAKFSADKNGKAELRLVRGQTGRNTTPLPRSIQSVLDLGAIEIINDMNVRVLGANLNLAGDDVRKIRELRVINRDGEIVFESKINVQPGSDIRQTISLKNTGKDADATAQAKIAFRQLREGTVQSFSLQVHQLDEKRPYALQIVRTTGSSPSSPLFRQGPEGEPFSTDDGGNQGMSVEDNSGPSDPDMELPCTVFPVASEAIFTPSSSLPEIMLRAPVNVPPIVLSEALIQRRAPSPAFPKSAVPAALVPM